MLLLLPKVAQQKLCPAVGTEAALDPLLHFSCACKETQPNPILRRCLEQPSRVQHARGKVLGGPCLHKQSREAGNQLVGFLLTAANEQPRFSCQLPPEPGALLRASTPNPESMSSPAAADGVGEVLGNRVLQICIV